MTIDIKKALLTGTAIVAVGAIATPTAAQAQANLSLTASDTWADGGGGELGAAAAGDNVDITGDGLTITVTNDGVADDGGGVNAFTIGTITDSSTAEDGALAVTTGAAADMTLAITAATLDGNVSMANTANDGDIATTLTGALTAGGTLVVNAAADATTADALTLTVGGATAVTSTTAITASGNAGAAATLVDLNGNATFTGAATVTGGANAGSTATLSLAGATNTFTGDLTLTDGAAGAAILTLDGTVAQTVSGNIAGTGDINVDNALGATFSGTVGAGTNVVLIENAAANSAATFQNTTNVASITLGGAGTDTNTVTFDTTTNDFTVTGTVDGAIAGETNAVVVSGGGTLTTATAWGGVAGEIDTLTVSGTGTNLTSGAAVTATATTIGSGATFASGAALTSNVTVSGTLQQTAAATITGTIDGAGTLDIDAATTVAGIIGGTTALTAIDVAPAIALTTSADVTATTTTLSGASTGSLVLGGGGANQTLTTNIVAATTGAGVITVADGAFTTAFVGNVGASGATLLSLDTLTGAGASAVTVTGNLFVDTTTITDATDSLTFVGTSAQTASGAIDGAGILNVGSTTASDVTFNGIIGGGTAVASMSVDALATARLNANATVTGAYTNGGNTNLAVGTTLTAGSFAGTGTYNIAITDDGDNTLNAADFGSLASGGAIDLAGETVAFDINGNVATGAAVVLGTGGGAAVAAGTVSDNSFVFDVALAAVGNDHQITITRNALAANSGNRNGKAVGAVFDTLTASADAQIILINNQIAAAPNQAALDEVLEATTPTVDGGAVAAGFSTSTQSLGVTNTRIASLRDGIDSSGIATGQMGNGLKAWGQIFGSTAEQDERDNIDGYEADTYGIAVGIDSEEVFEDSVVGLAFSYADTEVDSDNANSTNTEIDSYQITLYGDHDLDDRTYWSGMLGFAFNDNDQTRFNVGGVAGLTANGDFDSEQYIVYTEVGRDYSMGGNATITPRLLAHYQHIEIDGFTETGAGGANLTTDTDDMDVFELGLGATVEWESQNSDGSYLKPNLHAEVRHDLVGDEVDTTSTFQAGGASFSSQGADPAETSFNIGTGVTWYTTTNWELTANYDFNVKSDYDAHSGFLRAGYKF